MKKDTRVGLKINIKGSVDTGTGAVDFEAKTLPGRRVSLAIEAPIDEMKVLVTTMASTMQMVQDSKWKK